MRRPLVAGNWKMNLSHADALQLIEGIRTGMAEAAGTIEVAVCPPAIYLYLAANAVKGSEIAFGAQNIYHEPKGAFTGEVSAEMVAESGAKYVILGHSERRHTIGHLEDDRMINLKVRAAQRAGLTPILCVGETLEERDKELTLDVLTYQLRAGLIEAAPTSSEGLVIAYEPVWAIGTGRNATPEQAQEAHAHLRAELRKVAGDLSDQIRILYGGSMKPENAGELIGQPDIDGGLVGGASLKSDAFLGIIQAALATTR